MHRILAAAQGQFTKEITTWQQSSNSWTGKGYQVWSITADKSVYDALRLMGEKEIGALTVMDGDKLVGILSERDYARKVVLKGKTSRETLVSEIMSFAGPVHPPRPECDGMHGTHDRQANSPPACAGQRQVDWHDLAG